MLLALLLTGCLARAVAPLPHEDLAGFEAPLFDREGPVRASVQGSLKGRPVEVELELASPLSRISGGCFEGEIHSPGSVDAPKWSGGFERLPEVKVSGAKVGELTLAERMMALSPRTDACVLTLGTDVLAPYVMEVDPQARTLALRAPTPELPAAWRKAAHLQLTRDPRTDWPLLPAQLFRGDVVKVSTFVLSTARAQSALAPASFARQGEAQPEGATVDVDALELAPSVGVSRLNLPVQAEWKQPVAAGVLGADVWGWFKVRISPHAGHMELLEVAGHRGTDGARPAKPLVPDEPEPEDPGGTRP